VYYRYNEYQIQHKGIQMKLTEMQDLLVQAIGEIEKYKETGTKASSKRVRKYLNDIKKNVTDVKRKLIEADENGTIAE